MANQADGNDVVFFLGSGASVAAGIPPVQPMTNRFVEHVAKDLPALKGTLDQIINLLKPRIKGGAPDIEAILEITDTLINFSERPISAFVTANHGLEKDRLSELKKALERFIRRSVISPGDVSYLDPLLDATWGESVDIFSVNYDPCIELLCRSHQRRLVDGFNPEWNPRELEKRDGDAKAVYLYKLHGSVLWYRSKKNEWYVKIPIAPGQAGSPEDVTLYDGEEAEPVLLYPMYKQPTAAPLLDFTYMLRQRLEKARFLIVIGYSFRDKYLNNIFRDVFRARRDLHMVVIAPDARQRYLDLLKESPVFKSVFQHRVTCYPFPIEKFLRRFTFETFTTFSSAILRWQEHCANARTGRERLWRDVVEDFSNTYEAELSGLAFDWGDALDQLGIQTTLAVAFKNYAMAIALSDPELEASTYDWIWEVFAKIYPMLYVQANWFSEPQFGWQFRQEGGSSPGLSVVTEGSRSAIEFIDKFIHIVSDPAVGKRLKDILERLRRFHDTWEDMGRNGAMPTAQFLDQVHRMVDDQPTFDNFKRNLSKIIAEGGSQVSRLSGYLYNVTPTYPPVFRLFQFDNKIAADLT